MQSKFAGTCTECKNKMPEGTKILWRKGAGAKHVECPAAPATAPVKKLATDNTVSKRCEPAYPPIYDADYGCVYHPDRDNLLPLDDGYYYDENKQVKKMVDLTQHTEATIWYVKNCQYCGKKDIIKNHERFVFRNRVFCPQHLKYN